MNYLLMTTACIELGAGIALLLLPAAAAELLLGASPGTSVGTMLGRVAGAALLALGVACWGARRDKNSPAARGLVTGLLLYNVLVVALFVWAGLGLRLIGLAIWPAVVLHSDGRVVRRILEAKDDGRAPCDIIA